MVAKRTRVLIVDSSLSMRLLLSDVLAQDAGVEVAGAVGHAQAPAALMRLRPDVMTLDIDPGSDSIELLKQVMQRYPLPVLAISASPGAALDAMQAGAVDFAAQPGALDGAERDAFMAELLIKLKIASVAKAGRYKSAATGPEPGPGERQAGATACAECGRVVAIGASTGGTEAIASILMALGPVQAGIVIVQHMPPVFTRMYAERLNGSGVLEVREACDGDSLMPGLALLAPGGLQMELERYANGFRVHCREGEKVSGHCPSVNVLFHSAAKAAGECAMGVILTGMGADGAEGLLAMRAAGACTIGQNKETCVVYGMPMVANALGAVESELPLAEIPQRIRAWIARE